MGAVSSYGTLKVYSLPGGAALVGRIHSADYLCVRITSDENIIGVWLCLFWAGLPRSGNCFGCGCLLEENRKVNRCGGNTTAELIQIRTWRNQNAQKSLLAMELNFIMPKGDASRPKGSSLGTRV